MVNEEIKKKIFNEIDNWESCDEVKPPTEEDKIELAINMSIQETQKHFKDEVEKWWNEKSSKSIDTYTEIYEEDIKELLSKLENQGDKK